MDFVVHKTKRNLTANNYSLTDSRLVIGSVYTSDPVDIQGFSLYSVQTSYDNVDTAPATLRIQGSNDNEIWTDVDVSICSVSLSSNSRLLNVEKAGYSLVRLTIDPGVGSVTNFKAILNGKVL
jgi:ABC-type ATPase involved in cell division